MTLELWKGTIRWKAAGLALSFAGFAILSVALAETGRSVLIVLDASGSMNAPLEGRTRLAAAKAAVHDFVSTIDADTRVALRVYGHQSAPDKKDCQDSELMVDFASVAENRQALLSEVAEIKARGYTPITLSLQRAAKDIAGELGAERTVMLVSDGRETCSADPCVAAKALAAVDAKLVVHTIGFGVNAAARSQLQCIASVARGSYFDAQSRDELAAVINEAAETGKTETIVKVTAKTGTLSAPRIKQNGLPLIQAETGARMDFIGGLWPKRELPPGIYSVKMTNGLWTGIEIRAGETTVLEPAFLRIDLGHVSGRKYHQNLYLHDPETGAKIGFFAMLVTPEVAMVPGGVVPKITGFAWPSIELSPGQTTVLRPGAFRISDPLSKRKPVVYVVTPSAGGRKHSFTAGRPVYVPPGKYLTWNLKAPGEKIEFEAADGKLVEIKIDRQ